MSRVAIFASFDKDGIVHDYVISYLKRLKRVAEKIIFISDNNAKNEEIKKLSDLVVFSDFSPHGEYDFGSYKRGYQYAMKHGLLEEADELVLCNDSCFSVMDFDDMFAQMSRKSCDFWGVTDSIEIQYHLQSYFLVFKKNVFTHKEFANFLNSVVWQDNVNDVIKNYEIALTPFLQNINFTSGVFIKHQEKINPTMKPITLLEQNIPLIKRKVFVLQDACIENVRSLLFKLKKEHRDSYIDICNYYKKTFSRFSPLVLPYSFCKVKRFLYQKKISKSGKLIVKVCKVPVPQIFFKRRKYVRES